ncbi:MAG: GNAT family N-acetyltransferase [Legionellales bacterium]|nr:GNAT family N-acetyltransferase [Legionellales bacterium]
MSDNNNETMADKTGADSIQIVKALSPREWEAIRHFRQYYFFDKASIIDPYTWTFNHEKHDHLVLYKGSLMVGYAHLQYWPESRVALRIIVVDEPHRNQGLGSEFLHQIELSLKEHGIEKIHVQSSPEAYQFYCQNNYIDMPFNDPDGYESCSSDIDMGKIL